MNEAGLWKAVGSSPLTGLQVPIVPGPSEGNGKWRFSKQTAFPHRLHDK